MHTVWDGGVHLHVRNHTSAWGGGGEGSQPLEGGGMHPGAPLKGAEEGGKVDLGRGYEVRGSRMYILYLCI